VFWGGLIPRMSWWELEAWPQAVRWYLEDHGYALAEELLKRSQLDSDYQRQVRSELTRSFSDYVVMGAPMAVQHSLPRLNTISAGVFSTADLLLESRLTGGPSGNQNLTVNLNHAAVQVLTAGGRATGVLAHDLIADMPRTYRAKAVVLAAGTVESAKLAQLSGLNDPSGSLGQGITDHPIFFTHFALPAGAPLHRVDAAAKLLLQHKNARVEAGTFHHRYNLVLELGADFNQGRFVDPEIFAAAVAARNGLMLCELVLLFDAPLVPGNAVMQQGPSYVKPLVQMQEPPIAVAEWNEINALRAAVLNQLGAIPLPGGNLDLVRAPMGGVAHEVGTLRMGAQGVVDENLKFRAYPNLYACDLSVFPSSPAANPTLTLAALALRLAEHLRGTL
jgi:choline dehydrogenase-like flavoprotein